MYTIKYNILGKRMTELNIYLDVLYQVMENNEVKFERVENFILPLNITKESIDNEIITKAERTKVLYNTQLLIDSLPSEGIID